MEKANGTMPFIKIHLSEENNRLNKLALAFAAKQRLTVMVHISPETNRWNTYACKLVELARKRHKTILISSLTDKEIADAGIVF